MKIAKLFFDVHMGYGHNGLGLLLKKKLEENEYAVFINRAWTAVKMLTPQGVLLHYKDEKLGINPETIQHLPYCVKGGQLQYKKALRSVITNKYKG